MIDFHGDRGRFIGEYDDGIYRIWDQYAPLSYWAGLLPEVGDGFTDADEAVDYLEREYPEEFGGN